MVALLERIDNPYSLRQLKPAQLPALAKELREFMLASVAKTGGHLASNLGTVELTIALHYIFDTPDDRLIWDVGHQSYPHKILTGRRDKLPAIRTLSGISGFPRRDESEYDTFGTGHSSTALSAIMGMAQAIRLRGEHRHCIAVIGDGALSAGLAYKAMNNILTCANLPLLVILNDNDMSISPSVGGLKHHLAALLKSHGLQRTSPGNQHILAKQTLLSANTVTAANTATLFSILGFEYSGPIDGHDFNALLPALFAKHRRKGPQLLHVVTRKGQGYPYAETDPVLYHGPGKFSSAEGIIADKSGIHSYAQTVNDWLCDEAACDPRVVAITPAMCEGSALNGFRDRFPERYFDVGIAEQHAVTFAGGLAAEGFRPVVAIYSTFLQRAYDQLIHDIAPQNLPVVFAIDRAGVVGADGATHMGAFDIA